MSDRSGDGARPSRWGPSKRAREEDRGYSINDRSMPRRVDDRNHSGHHRNDDDYYGRIYEERPRHSNGDGRGRDREERPRYSDDGRYEQRARYLDDRGYDQRSGRDRGGRGYEEQQRDRYDEGREWQCTECGIFNYDCDERCDRCGTRPRKMPRYRSTSQDGPDDDDSDAKQQSKGPTWPPPFESGGAAYDFHPSSGMFYEAIADFFYDPKTKLYYGNKQKVYYTYRPGEDPLFCALEAPPASEDAAAPTSEAAGPKPEDKKKIAISLKTTVLPGESKAAKQPKPHKTPKKVKAALPEPKKQDVANIEVWAERGKEIREAGPTKKPPMTTTKKPVCLLCRRKFASIEKLKKHEELSALHKENLEKKRKEDEAKKERESSMEYRDRALERRIMHGPEAASMPALPRDLDASTATREADGMRPEDNLGASNIGNQMLQKLGWKSGSSLGRGATNADGGQQESVQNTLVKDWEKIESLAASGQQGRFKPNSKESGFGN